MNSKIEYIKGDLLEVDADIIVQQCNCITTNSCGLAKSISDKLGVNIYKSRKSYSHNLAIKEYRDIPGTCKLVQSFHHNKYVACLLAQFAPGKSGKYYKNIVKAHEYKDDKDERLFWFKTSLEDMYNQIKELNIDNLTIAFPKYIGCGLAGGCWDDYLGIIEEWASLYNIKKILIIHL